MAPRAATDVDLLVEFLPGSRPTLLDVAQIEMDLSPALGRRKVDQRTSEDLSPHFRQKVARAAAELYRAV